MGDAIATNLFMLGYAFQMGFVPISMEALMQAIDLNGIAVESNKQAFSWGRAMADNADAVEAEVVKLSGPAEVIEPSNDIDEIIAKRKAFLTDYQDAAYARRYVSLVERIKTKEAAISKSTSSVSKAVAKSLFKLMAYKDEYEVARLYTDTGFMEKIDRMMEGDYKVKYNLAPPLFAKKDPHTGELKKSEYGPWMKKAFEILPRFKFLRGTALDPFGYLAERKEERLILKQFEGTVSQLIEKLTADNYATAIEIAELPMKVRGYGHVKDKAISQYRKDLDQLMGNFKNPAPQKQAAE